MDKFKNIKMLVMDVDGTLTDGRLYFSTQGDQIKAFDAKDGCGIKIILPQLNIIPVIITSHQTSCVPDRMNQLGVEEVYQGIWNKIEALDEVIQKYGLKYDEVAVIGDDINDISLFEVCGLNACPADACEEIKALSDVVMKHNGGRGAVRELIEMLKKAVD